MNKKLTAVILAACLLVVAVFVYFYFSDSEKVGGELKQVQYVPGALKDYPNLAAELSGKINQISPTRSFDEVGWIAVRVSFVPEEALAYLEYTDTHVTLRLLLQYGHAGQELLPTVLATFRPREIGGWELQHGRDVAAGISVYHYRYNGDAKQWISEASSI